MNSRVLGIRVPSCNTRVFFSGAAIASRWLVARTDTTPDGVDSPVAGSVGSTVSAACATGWRGLSACNDW